MTDDPANWGYYRPAREFFDGLSDEEIAEWREELRTRAMSSYHSSHSKRP